MSKTAVILFNLGGPDNPAAVRPFLFNLFNDPAIIGLPRPLRYLIAKLISSRRNKTAQAIYGKIGGGSPILPNTERQAQALEQKVPDTRCFVAMRYWHPLVEEMIDDVKKYAPDNIILLPLYPQYSTTTTASSLASWHQAAKKEDLKIPTRTICCYPEQPGFIAALVAKIRTAYDAAQQHGTPRLLFSAHGLPEKIVLAGDPYPLHCQRTVDALKRELNIDNLDAVLCYQSRVGPLKWIGPSTDEEIKRAGRDKVPLVVAPIAFVSEHSETLVEIDMEYRHLALSAGVPSFTYTGTVADDGLFMDGLAALVRMAQATDKAVVSGTGLRLCPQGLCSCGMDMSTNNT